MIPTLTLPSLFGWLAPPKFTRVQGADIVMESIALNDQRSCHLRQSEVRGPNEMPGEAASVSAPGRELICDFYEAPRCAGPVATDGPMVEGRWLSERRCPRERSSVP